MMGSWIVYAILVGGLLAAAAHAAAWICQIAQLPTRWGWATALALTVALVGVAPYRGDTPVTPARTGLRTVPSSVPTPAAIARVSRPDAPATFVHSATSVWNALTGTVARLAYMTRATTSDAIAIAGDQLPTRAGRYCLIAWGVLSALLWLVFATVAWHFHRARRGWPVTKLHGIRVLVAPDVGPVVVGVLHPAVVIPQWLLRRDTKEQRLALVHEQEHMRAGDPLVLAGACLVAALLPWHPAVWWMLARLRLAVELDCDRRVLGQGIAPRAYGDLLIDLAGRCARLPISTSASALTDEASHLTRRLLAMKRSRIPLARTRGVALGSVALLTVVFACTVPAPNQDVTFLRWRGRAATIPDVAIPRSIAAAEAEGTAWPRDSIVDTTRWARLPKTGGSPERKCLTTDDGGRDRAPGYIEIRTGDFRIGGQLDSLAAGRTPRMWIWWDPLHDPAIRRSGLLVRAALLDAPGLPNSTNTARFTMLDYIRPGDPLGSNPTDEEIRAELEHYRSAALFGSALTLPMRGRWLLVATSGDDWGCLVVNVR